MSRFQHREKIPKVITTSVGRIEFKFKGISDDLPKDISDFLREKTMVSVPGLLTEVDKDGNPVVSKPVDGYDKKGVPELLALAKERNLAIPEGAKKADLVKLLEEADKS